ncbi:MAG: hypothetical protein A2729_05845 [Candidatus Buchananbacteria bacterium RIFCSPHIGHO2_01_FULL_39_14]|uniref:Methyltransferase type 11 domain-containing protein n=1 Tax=Candidatus Buchananbacteria bacterium RIFCSPHIGHO2_01_FULL_39_14 TaxID=1797532 RepID=A0A1G1XSP5_9BACT|nr:MAG: hypothetical protein A2729_05845 [Candidatus Buchananbacteria bacterium RIFCSPHIGHO2_01_FULL_39_14]
MSLAKDFIKVLCCPKRLCRGDLLLKSENDREFLICNICQTNYPIEQGIPILFPNTEYSPDLFKRHWDLKENAESYAAKYNSYLKKQGTPWGLYTHFSELLAIDKLISAVNFDLSGKTIMDFGCGNCRFLTHCEKAKIKIGVDTSLNLLLDAKKRNPSYWLVCGQLEDLPFKDAMADFSCSIRVYQHIRSPLEAFSEMVRVTKPSGYVSLEIYNKLNLKEIYKRIRMTKWLDKIWSWGLDYDCYYSYREIKKWCEVNFIKPLKFVGSGWGFYFYLLEPLRFRGHAPNFFQKLIYNSFFALEKLVSHWPLISVTMEKISFIGRLQEKAKSQNLWQKTNKTLKRKTQAKKIKNWQKIFENRNYCLVGDDGQHLKLTIDWLKKAQDATSDGGVSRGFSLIKEAKSNILGWQPSYPETTGYIIPTFIIAAKILNDSDLIRRAKLMADWEISLMDPEGWVQSGNLSQLAKPEIFDTGAVIRGLLAIYQQTKDEKYLKQAIKAGEWILSQNPGQESKSYYVYALAPLARLGTEFSRPDFVALVKNFADYVLSQQEENGWINQADFKSDSDVLLHPLAYAINGLWEISTILKEEKYLEAARKSLDQVIGQMSKEGKIVGRLDKNWQPTVDWACLTGIAQIAETCCKIYEASDEIKYLNSAKLAKEYLKSCQNNFDNRFGGLGAVWGSWPINVGYCPNQALNWAAKYFADLLIYFIKNKKNA